MKKISELKKELDLSKRFPLWVNKNVSRIMFILIGFMIFLAFALNSFELTVFEYDCNQAQGCLNPFYNMTEGFREYSCSELSCGVEIVPYGFSVGEPSPIVENLGVIIFFLFVLIFPIARVVNAFKGDKI